MEIDTMSAKKKKTTKKPKMAIKRVGIENVKSFMKMNKDMVTAVYGFAGELKSRGTEISPTQLLTQSLKYLKTYSDAFGLSLPQLADRVSAVDGKDYSVTSAEVIKEWKKTIADEKKLTREANSQMRVSATKRKTVRKVAGKKSAAKRKSKSDK